MKPLHRLFGGVCILLFVGLSVLRAQSSPQITADELLKHVKYLASDQLEGRRAGSRGAQLAAQYIANEFKSYGLKPVGDNGTYFQNFEFASGVKLGAVNTFAYATDAGTRAKEVGKDFEPLGFSGSGTVRADLVFAGYGISAPDQNYDDYAGLDVKDKVVLVLRNSPPSDSSKDFARFVSLRYKAAKAKELGAKALIVVTGPVDSDTDDLLKLNYGFDPSAGNAGIVIVNVTRRLADEMLRREEATVKDLQATLDRTKAPKSFAVRGVTIAATIELAEIQKSTANVVGLLEGNDPALKDQIVVIGAHYDHLGYGGEGSGSLKPDTVAIHHGADDNASGVAGLLELAQAYASNRTELKRSLLFLSFSGEELGLLGSAFYVKNPIFPLDRTVCMINMDMIGRLRNRDLIVYGIGTSQGFESLVKKYDADSAFVLKLNKDGYGPSDQSSFYGKKIPVLFFFTDIHPDYHRPSDTYDKINYDGERQVVRYVESIATELDQSSERPQYVAVEAPRPMQAGRSTRVYMGTIPDFGEQVEGMKLAGVREGGPAAKAGLQAGDIIVKFGKVDIKNLYDFTYALGDCRPGDEVDVVVKRGGEMKTFRVKLEKRN
jgi:aminopeptidase YwaD